MRIANRRISSCALVLRGVTRGGKRGTIPRGPIHYGGAELLLEAPKSPNNVTSTFNTVNLPSKELRCDRRGAKLRPWGRRICFLPRAPSNLVTPLLVLNGFQLYMGQFPVAVVKRKCFHHPQLIFINSKHSKWNFFPPCVTSVLCMQSSKNGITQRSMTSLRFFLFLQSLDVTAMLVDSNTVNEWNLQVRLSGVRPFPVLNKIDATFAAAHIRCERSLGRTGRFC